MTQLGESLRTLTTLAFAVATAGASASAEPGASTGAIGCESLDSSSCPHPDNAEAVVSSTAAKVATTRRFELTD